MEETVTLDRLQADMNEACKKVDDALWAESESSEDSEFSLDSDDYPDTDDETKEAQKKRSIFARRKQEKELYKH